MRENPQAAPSPIGKQTLLLLQALTAIIFTGVSVYIATAASTIEIEGILSGTAELFFISAIANLVFFHTFDIYSRDNRALRLLAITALGSIVISLLISCAYFLLTTLR